ncbi:MAG: hypothetical protein ACXWQO_07545 [Bdellovibrionota bacterium]
MQNRPTARLERAVAENDGFKNVVYLDEKQMLFRRMERWVRLQQFVYGLSDDFCYSVFASKDSGISTCRTLVRVGEMSWYGEGRAADQEQALSLALVATSEAISASSYKVFMYSLTKWLRSFWGLFRRKPAVQLEEAEVPEESLLAG